MEGDDEYGDEKSFVLVFRRGKERTYRRDSKGNE